MWIVEMCVFVREVNLSDVPLSAGRCGGAFKSLRIGTYNSRAQKQLNLGNLLLAGGCRL